MKFVFSFLVIMLSTACTSYNKESSIQNLIINIKKINSDTYTATYVLPSMSEGLVFLRQNNQFRMDNWNVLNSNLQIEKVNGYEVLKAKDGSRFDKVTVQFKPYLKTTPKDYEFFLSYSDGSYLFYTGHLYAKSVDQIEELKENFFDNKINKPISVNFETLTNEHLIFQGKILKEQVHFTDVKNEGTYILNPHDFSAKTV